MIRAKFDKREDTEKIEGVLKGCNGFEKWVRKNKHNGNIITVQYYIAYIHIFSFLK